MLAADDDVDDDVEALSALAARPDTPLRFALGTSLKIYNMEASDALATAAHDKNQSAIQQLQSRIHILGDAQQRYTQHSVR